ncbi:MAG: alcohol dehydrogenase catalytic domain-containing protein [Alphaproteobacteria bacterium]
MKALVYTGPKQLVYKDVAEPNPSEGQALIDLDCSGICGSDMHAYLGHDERRPAPLILGHEAAGVIQNGPEAGRRVTINPLVSCGVCEACQEGRDNICPSRRIISMPPVEGSFAERLAMRMENLVTVPDHVPLWQAALTEPMACGWHAVKLALRLSHRAPDQMHAVVLGGGAIGIGSALSLAALGVNSVTVLETNPGRLARLRQDLPQFEFHASFEDSGSKAPDLVIDAVGFAPTRQIATTIIKPGGVIAHIGLGEATGGLDVRRMTLQEITFCGTYTYTAEDFRETAAAIFRGDFGDFKWVEQRSLSDGAQAFADLLDGRVDAGKIVLMT